jgi:hypothetical protein
MANVGTCFSHGRGVEGKKAEVARGAGRGANMTNRSPLKAGLG